MRMAILRGERLELTPMRLEDAAEVARWQQKGDYLRWFDTVPAVPKTETQVRKQIEAAHERHDGFLFAIRRIEDDRLLGQLELDGIVWPHGTSYISIVIYDPTERGKGYGNEALRLGLSFAFDELNLHRIALTVFSYNTQAIRLYEQLGFRHEGTHREQLRRDGERYDMLMYGLLRREWEMAEGKGQRARGKGEQRTGSSPA